MSLERLHGAEERKGFLGLLGPRPWMKIAMTLAVLAVGGWFLSRGLSPEKILAAFGRFDAGTLLLVFLCSMAQIGLMVGRTVVLAPSEGNFTFAGVLRAVVFGHGVNAVFPAKAGEALKAVLLGRMSSEKSLGVGVGVLLAERISELVGLVVLILTSGVLALPLLTGGNHPHWAVILLGVLGTGAVAFVVIRAGSRRWAALRKLLEALWVGLKGMRSPYRAAASFLLAWASWVVEVLAIQLLADALGYNVTYSQGVFVLVVLNLAILLPVSMANLGTFEASIAFALGSFGVATEAGVALAGTHHLVQWVAVGTWVAIGWATLRFPRDFTAQLTEHLESVSRNEIRLEEERKILRLEPGFEEMMEALDVGPGERLLDVACHHGLYSLEAKARGAYVYACDGESSNVLSLIGKVDETEVATPEYVTVEEKFTRVLLFHALTRSEDRSMAFVLACRKLAPGGRLILRDHGTPDLWKEVRTLAETERLDLHTAKELPSGEILMVYKKT